MQQQPYGIVKVLEFRAYPRIEFEEIVEELDLSLRMVDAQKRSLIWESDDIAILERGSINLAFGWLPSCAHGTPWRLVVAVGAPPNETGSELDIASYEYVATSIVTLLEDAFTLDAVLRCEASQPVGGQLVDTMFELLLTDMSTPGRSDAPPTSKAAFADCDDIMTKMYSHCPEHTAPKGVQNGTDNTNYTTEGLRAPSATSNTPPDLANLDDPTDQLRLTIHTLALSLVLYAPPLGAFLFVYTMLRDTHQVAT